MNDGDISLEDKYTARTGKVYLSGIQALVRISLDRVRIDREAGLNTGGLISGYRGSPLGTFDTELMRAQRYIDDHQIHFNPGVNEELGATAVFGSQKVRGDTHRQRKTRFDGVFGIWYGKAPGVDRAGDAIRHANASGTDPLGGVLALAGDDPGAKSSIIPVQSEYFFQHVEIPVLNPSDIQEVMDFGLHGLEMSRHSSLWSAMICVSDTMDGSATVDVTPTRLNFKRPIESDPRRISPQNRDLAFVDRFQREKFVRGLRLPAAQSYARENGLDRVAFGARTGVRLGLVTTGKAYKDLIQSLALIGLTERKAVEAGIGIYKIGLSWPIDPVGLGQFARGTESILVVEHKRPVLESQIKEIAYHWPDVERPKVWGKTSPEGNRHLSDVLELSASDIIDGILSWLPADIISPDMRAAAERVRRQTSWATVNGEIAIRTPYFCSGCPHSTSTLTPEGSRSMPGVGCHAMTEMAGRTTEGEIAMGCEGALWPGMAPFSGDGHIFANIGDGTYFHSGILAIRQAVTSNVRMTYKILFNDAIAMTGGQKVDGTLTVPQITRQLAAEGVRRIAVVSEYPENYGSGASLAPGTTVHDRDDILLVQEEMRNEDGISVIVYDQTCAAEKRRRRKRGLYPDPDKRLFINERVCEGCGDCTTQSNCLSVEPLETPFGTKRAINQSSCNKDFSCIKGFCPAFVEIEGANLKKPLATPSFDGDLTPPAPNSPDHGRKINLLLTGVGGTGVTTISAILAMAGHIEGKQVSTLDMTGMAQKGGPVTSHIRIAPPGEDIFGPRVPPGELDVLIAGDLVVAANSAQLALANPEKTITVADTRVTPTSEFALKQTLSYVPDRMEKALRETSNRYLSADVSRIAEGMFGDPVYANLMMVGAAYQMGCLPLSAQAIEKAVKLNGAAVDMNVRAFNAGRLLAHDPNNAIFAIPEMRKLPETSEDRIEFFSQELKSYQDQSYADLYLSAVHELREVERTCGESETPLTNAVASNLFKLMAYKDEYEVARLYSSPEFRRRIQETFEDPRSLKIHLAPPLLPLGKDRKTGRPRKITFGPWIFRALSALSRFKFARGRWFDPFGHTAERKFERMLVGQYLNDVRLIRDRLRDADHDLLMELARIPEGIKGFGDVKSLNVTESQRRRTDLLRRIAEISAE